MSLIINRNKYPVLLSCGVVTLLGVLGYGNFQTAEAQSSTSVDFTRDVQPIFQKSCYGCHGAKMSMGGLRLDSKTSAFTGGQSGVAIKPGSSADSILYQRVAGMGDQAKMPMGGSLSLEAVQTIKKWIDGGAAWPDSAAGAAATTAQKKHWAFVAPVRPPLPVVETAATQAAWTKNPIDRFVLSRLQKENLVPSPEADRVTLLRRVSLDLTGLPPTPEEVDRFLRDTSKDAYAKEVERLLASPHYGERWGRFWLDAARYADSDGYEKDKIRQAWFYRDWVIHAMNRDLPYNQFVVEQLAGDLLPNPTQDQIVATGYLRNSMLNEEGGVDPEQFRMEAMFDRMDAVGKGILGITIQCAQCHNHKFDPLTQEEYYRMFAFLNDSHEATSAVYTPAEQQKRTEIFRGIREIEQNLKRKNPNWRAEMLQWENQVRQNQPEWTVLKTEVDDNSTGGERYLSMKDDSYLAQGYAPTKHRVKITGKTVLPKVQAFRLELLMDPNLPLGGPGRSIYGSGALTEFEVEAAPTSDPKQITKVKFLKATADINLPEQPLPALFYDKSKNRRVTGPVAYAIDGDDKTAWGIDAGPGLRNQPRKAVFVADKPISFPGGTILTFYLKQNHGGWNSDDNQNNNLGRIRLSVSPLADVEADPLPAEVRGVLNIPQERRTPAQMEAVFRYWRTTVPAWQEANAEIAAYWKQYPEGSSQMVLQQREVSRDTHILVRGDYLKPGKTVKPGVPAFLNPLPTGAPMNRLTFAKWMTDRSAPTTARSFVNRLWQMYFGTGLVATSEDFGRQSDAPSHPELLDWLAVEFMDNGWSMKSMHRLIVNSATYRQSSRITPELLGKDPYNRLLARGPRFRVEGEMVRDITLSASGLLDDQIGGPSVFPPAPAFLFQPPVSYGPKVWTEATGAERYRRAIYTFRYRSVPYPMLQVFDVPTGESACIRRSRSDTPMQALVSLNEPLFMEAARALALKTLREGGSTDSERISYAFRRCMARKPNSQEIETLAGLLQRQTKHFSDGEHDPWSLLSGETKSHVTLPEKTTPATAAAYMALSRVLLNLDETISKE